MNSAAVLKFLKKKKIGTGKPAKKRRRAADDEDPEPAAAPAPASAPTDGDGAEDAGKSALDRRRADADDKSKDDADGDDGDNAAAANDDDDDDDDDDDESDDEPKVIERKVLPKRRSRGLRVNKLVGEAAEADALFWEQKAFDEAASDEEFSDTDSSADSSDSDIDAPEPEEEAPPKEAKEPRGGADKEKKKNYLDPTAMRKRRRAAMKRRLATKPQGPDNRPSQRDVLLEAAGTTVENQRALEAMLRLEEAKKGKAEFLKRPTGRRVVFHSRTGHTNTVTFTEVDSFPPSVHSGAVRYPRKRKCAITGKPAKYYDPLTRQPYATIEAFKELRRRYEEDGGRDDDDDDDDDDDSDDDSSGDSYDSDSD